MPSNFCDNCGAAVTPGKKFCSACGAPTHFDEPPPAPAQAPVPPQPPLQAPSVPPGWQQPVGVPQKKKGGKIALIVVGCAVVVVGLVIALILVAAGGILKSTANAGSYQLGNDSIPSVKTVVGLRSVSGTSTSTSTGGVTTKVISYNDTQSIQQDLADYAAYLQNSEGFIVTGAYDFNVASGTAQLAKLSVDSGQIIILDITYDQTGFTLTFTKGAGTLTPTG